MSIMQQLAASELRELMLNLAVCLCALCLQGTGTASSVRLNVSTSLNMSWIH